ncbi:MAG: MBL fold metallo-hydrolase, partial [Armatimonadia bacterium]
MPADYRYAAYPSAHVYDEEGNQIHHLLWGDWVQVNGPETDGKVPVHVRGVDGFMEVVELQKDRLLEIVFVDVGQGDGCLIVTPDDRKIVVDAGVADNMYRYLRWRFQFREDERTFDAAVITHSDADHYYGFRPLFSDHNVRFEHIYHNGIMEYDDRKRPLGPVTKQGGQTYLTDLMVDRPRLEAFLAEPSLYGKKEYPKLIKNGLERVPAGADRISMLAAHSAPDQPVFMPGFEADQPVSIHVLGPVPEISSEGAPLLRWFRESPTEGSVDVGKTKNGHSVILRLEYRGVSILLGGDLNSSAESFLLQHYSGLPCPPADSNAEQTLIEAARTTLESDIAKSCHHGSADFTDAFLRAVNPAATVVSSGDAESYAHPRCDTLGAIGLHGRGWRPLVFCTELARSTREDEGNRGVELG